MDRENNLLIDFNEDIETSYIPSETEIIQLREIKKIRKQQMEESRELNFEEYRNNPERKLARFIQERIPRGKKEERIKEIIVKIKELQTRQNISEFSRDFLNSILDEYSIIVERKKRQIVSEILSRASKNITAVSKHYLVKKPVDRIYEERGKAIEMFNFL